MAVSLVIGAAVYLYFKSLACGIASFLTGVFLDVDHFIDCYINYGLMFDLRNFYSYCMQTKFDRLTLLFHSYELVIILWVAIFVFTLDDIWKAVAIGVTQHIIIDHFVNTRKRGFRKRGYFLIFRLINRFKKDRLVRGPRCL